MADHKREQILAAVTTTLTGLGTTGANVTRGRVFTVDESELPHLVITQGPDEIVNPDGDDEATNIYLLSALTLMVEIINDASSGVLETTINQICKEIVAALIADPTQGGLAINTAELQTSQPELSDDRKKRTANTFMQFEILYKRLRADPSQ